MSPRKHPRKILIIRELPAQLFPPNLRYKPWKSESFVAVVVYFILSRLLYLAFSANLGLLCMQHPGMRPLV